jgi:hypothetical protein
MFAVRVVAALIEHDPHGEGVAAPEDRPVDPLRDAMRAVRACYCDLLDQRLAESGDEHWPGQGSLAADRQVILAQAMEWTQPVVTLFPPYPADTTARDALCAVIAVLLQRKGLHDAADILGEALIEAAGELRLHEQNSLGERLGVAAGRLAEVSLPT